MDVSYSRISLLQQKSKRPTVGVVLLLLDESIDRAGVLSSILLGRRKRAESEEEVWGERRVRV